MKRLIALTILFYFCIASMSWAGCTQGNCYNGKGTYTWSDGSKYVGEFKDGKKHGQGTFTWGSGKSKGDKYVGEWRHEEITGYGTVTFASGNKYVGEVKDSKPHGQGTFTYPYGTEERGYHMNDEFVPTICENIGLTKGTESFGQCVVELIKQIRDDD